MLYAAGELEEARWIEYFVPETGELWEGPHHFGSPQWSNPEALIEENSPTNRKPIRWARGTIPDRLRACFPGDDPISVIQFSTMGTSGRQIPTSGLSVELTLNNSSYRDLAWDVALSGGAKATFAGRVRVVAIVTGTGGSGQTVNFALIGPAGTLDSVLNLFITAGVFNCTLDAVLDVVPGDEIALVGWKTGGTNAQARCVQTCWSPIDE